jgi:hypothetical protein
MGKRTSSPAVLGDGVAVVCGVCGRRQPIVLPLPLDKFNTILKALAEVCGGCSRPAESNGLGPIFDPAFNPVVRQNAAAALAPPETPPAETPARAEDAPTVAVGKSDCVSPGNCTCDECRQLNARDFLEDVRDAKARSALGFLREDSAAFVLKGLLSEEQAAEIAWACDARERELDATTTPADAAKPRKAKTAKPDTDKGPKLTAAEKRLIDAQEERAAELRAKISTATSPEALDLLGVAVESSSFVGNLNGHQSDELASLVARRRAEVTPTLPSTAPAESSADPVASAPSPLEAYRARIAEASYDEMLPLWDEIEAAADRRDLNAGEHAELDRLWLDRDQVLQADRREDRDDRRAAVNRPRDPARDSEPLGPVILSITGYAHEEVTERCGDAVRAAFLQNGEHPIAWAPIDEVEWRSEPLSAAVLDQVRGALRAANVAWQEHAPTAEAAIIREVHGSPDGELVNYADPDEALRQAGQPHVVLTRWGTDADDLWKTSYRGDAKLEAQAEYRRLVKTAKNSRDRYVRWYENGELRGEYPVPDSAAIVAPSPKKRGGKKASKSEVSPADGLPTEPAEPPAIEEPAPAPELVEPAEEPDGIRVTFAASSADWSVARETAATRGTSKAWTAFEANHWRNAPGARLAGPYAGKALEAFRTECQMFGLRVTESPATGRLVSAAKARAHAAGVSP